MPNNYKATVELRALARQHGSAAIKELARLSTEARSEVARISACTALLDRAYGRAQPDQYLHIALPDTSTLQGISSALGSVVEAVGAGQLRPSEAQAICNIMRVRREAIELVELEQRLARLEKVASRDAKS